MGIDGLKFMIAKYGAFLVAAIILLATCVAGTIWYLKTPHKGGAADFNVYFDKCNIPDYKKEANNTLPSFADRYLAKYGIMHIGDRINQVRIDLLSLIIAIQSDSVGSSYQDMVCVLHEIGLTRNSEFIADISHFGIPLGNIVNESNAFNKSYPGPNNTTIKAWLEMPSKDNFWYVADKNLDIISNSSDPGTRDLVLEIRP